MNLVIRADGGPEIGVGHLMRTLALAQEWLSQDNRISKVDYLCNSVPDWVAKRISEEGAGLVMLCGTPGSDEDANEVIRYCREVEPSNWIILDGYAFGFAYQERLRAAGLKVFVLSDYAEGHHITADVLLNQNAHANVEDYEKRDSHTKLLLGAKFALIRKEFDRLAEVSRSFDSCSNLLVTLGGGDSAEILQTVMTTIKPLIERKAMHCRVVTQTSYCSSDFGDSAELVSNGEMPELMEWADVAISASGSTVWELAFAGAPMILISIADNQIAIGRHLHELGIAELIENGEDFSDQLLGALNRVTADSKLRKRLSAGGRALVDGHGRSRCMAAIRSVFRINLASSDGWPRERVDLFRLELEEKGHSVNVACSPDDIGDADVTFYFSFPYIVGPKVLRRSCHNLVFHASDLPEGKGWSPHIWQIIEGRNTITLTMFEATPELDAGPIVNQGMLRLEGHELICEIRRLLMDASFGLANRFVSEYPFNADSARSQESERPTNYYPKRGPDDSRLDPEKPLSEQFDLLRTVDNTAYPAFFELRGHKYILSIKKAELDV